MSRAKPAVVRFYLYPDVLGLARTRDSRIQQHPAEITAVKAHNARMVALSGDEARGTWQQLEVLMRHWRSGRSPGEPSRTFVYTATRRRLKGVDLE